MEAGENEKVGEKQLSTEKPVVTTMTVTAAWALLAYSTPALPTTALNTYISTSTI
jgi:hypothetical protein